MKQIKNNQHPIKENDVIFITFNDSWILNRFKRWGENEHLYCTHYDGDYIYLKPYTKNVEIYTFDNFFEKLWWIINWRLR